MDTALPDALICVKPPVRTIVLTLVSESFDELLSVVWQSCWVL